ncbi:MAG: class I SAM-dependent methyltransferase [Verrucomicrobia bacterium]|nr:class I SAM-dependent methyltransferase [Verrucomicrobiota bacterium]
MSHLQTPRPQDVAKTHEAPQPGQHARGYHYDAPSELQDETAARSPRRIAPLLYEIFAPQRVIDVGCGLGFWLREFHRLGAAEICGLDGAWVPRERLQIPPQAFTVCDLNKALPVTGPFDLALCLEVAEHLRSESAERLVASLCALSPVIVFSAAIPGQGGFEHINERFQDYWIEQFRAHGFHAHDLVRPRVWADPEVAFCYAQNLFVFVKSDAQLAPGVGARLAAAAPPGVSLATAVHPELYLQTLHQLSSLRGTIARVPVLISRALRRRFFPRRSD